MKYTLWFLTVLLSMPVYAQDMSNMDEKSMQQIMEQAAKMQACMENVDQSRLPELERRSRAMEAEIKTLCAQGKRRQAEQTAMDFAMEISQDKDLQAMRKCGEIMQGMRPALPNIDHQQSAESKHICDQ